jgi:FtsH-binding integral membrane protein
MGVTYGAATRPLVRTGAERATLVRRTYALVFGSVLVTMAGAMLGLNSPGLMQAVAEHWFIAFLCILAPLFLAHRMARSFPANIGLVGLFAFAEGVFLSPLLFIYGQRQPGIVGQAAVLTGSTFAVLTLYALVSRRDFSAWGGFFTVGLWVLLGAMVLNIFFHSPLAELWIAAVGVLVMSGLLIFDTWRLRNVFGPDDYVVAAVSIYLDLLNLFLFILRLLGGGRRN